MKKADLMHFGISVAAALVAFVAYDRVVGPMIDKNVD